jgi:hypothetical protein
MLGLFWSGKKWSGQFRPSFMQPRVSMADAGVLFFQQEKLKPAGTVGTE